MKTLLIVIICLIIGAGGALGFAKYQIASQPEPEFHEHADFAVFLNGQRFNFAMDEYMSDLAPCEAPTTFFDSLVPTALAHAVTEHSDDYPLERDYVHLHGGDGEVVHVHKEGTTWQEFFRSLVMVFNDEAFIDDEGNRYEVDNSHEFAFVVNGERVESLADREIRDQDRVLISYGFRNRDEQAINAEYGQIANRSCISSGACEQRNTAPAAESCSVTIPQPKLLEWLGIENDPH